MNCRKKVYHFKKGKPPILSFEFANIGLTSVTDNYPGPYTVTPKVTAQTLATDNKVMTENLVIEKIPITYTVNGSGYMATIG